MPNRREFLAASGSGLAALAGGWGPREADSTWLVYAPNVEQFWANRPFLERLKMIGEAGFTHYEFGRWKTKDTEAISKKNEELGLQAALFNAYPGLKGARWKEGLLESVALSAQLAPRLGALKLAVVAADRDEKVEREEQVDDLVDALKEAVEALGESEAVLILEPVRAVANRPRSLIASAEEAAAVVKAVGSDRVRFAFPIERTEVAGGKVPDLIKASKDRVGYYRLVDFGPPEGPVEVRHAQVLRTIHDVGHRDPIGLGLAMKGDPLAAIESIRKLDAAAKAL